MVEVVTDRVENSIDWRVDVEVGRGPDIRDLLDGHGGGVGGENREDDLTLFSLRGGGRGRDEGVRTVEDGYDGGFGSGFDGRFHCGSPCITHLWGGY